MIVIILHNHMQDQLAALIQQPYPNQWTCAYYGCGYDPYIWVCSGPIIRIWCLCRIQPVPPTGKALILYTLMTLLSVYQ